MNNIKMILSLGLSLSLAAIAVAQDEMREWTDSTGKFKITASLVEVKEGVAWLENKDGERMKIPVSRLSEADQEYLGANENPFKMAENATPTAPEASSGGVWAESKEVDFESVERLYTVNAQDFVDCVPDSAGLGFEPQRVPLPKKENFHEGMQKLVINSKLKRGVAAFSCSFGIPKPYTRISLLDLATGRSVHSEPVEAMMRPLALLDSGAAVLMVGTSDDRKGYERASTLEVWSLKGKKIKRTASWIPFPNASERFGRTTNAEIFSAWVVNQDHVLTLSSNGFVTLWNIIGRNAIWHARLNPKNFAIDLSPDRSRLAIYDDRTVMIVDPMTSDVLGATSLPTNARAGWNRIRWSPSCKRVLCSAVGELRVLNVESGEWEHDFKLSDAPAATRALSFPDEDFALLDNSLLVHLPSKIKVCQYSGATSIKEVGGESFIAMHGGDGGFVVAAKFPHPAAKEMLQTALDDPSTFLIHPGVGVTVDSTRAGRNQQEIRKGLEQSVARSGYKVDGSSSIRVVAEISGPKQRAVSYIARGSYIANEYISTIKIEWNGKTIWKRDSSNVPGIISTSGDETIQDVLDRLGKQPDLNFFGRVTFPEFMQRPSEDGNAAGNALMASKFTPQGLVDTK